MVSLFVHCKHDQDKAIQFKNVNNRIFYCPTQLGHTCFQHIIYTGGVQPGVRVLPGVSEDILGGMYN
jgi:hypothetical protein